MYLPRRLIASMRAPRSLRFSEVVDEPTRSRGSRISAASTRRLRTARRSARTTCSTSGSSGIRLLALIVAARTSECALYVSPYQRNALSEPREGGVPNPAGRLEWWILPAKYSKRDCDHAL